MEGARFERDPEVHESVVEVDHEITIPCGLDPRLDCPTDCPV